MGERFRQEGPGEVFGGSPQDYENRCYTFLVTLCNDKDMERAAAYLPPDCMLIHEDNPPVHGAKGFIESWGKLLQHMPNYHKVIKDILVEKDPESPNAVRVWMYSRITGITARVRDSVDMMHFSTSGLFLDSKDVQRDITVAS